MRCRLAAMVAPGGTQVRTFAQAGRRWRTRGGRRLGRAHCKRFCPGGRGRGLGTVQRRCGRERRQCLHWKPHRRHSGRQWRQWRSGGIASLNWLTGLVKSAGFGLLATADGPSGGNGGDASSGESTQGGNAGAGGNAGSANLLFTSGGVTINLAPFRSTGAGIYVSANGGNGGNGGTVGFGIGRAAAAAGTAAMAALPMPPFSVR